MYIEQCLLLYINLKFEVEYNLNIILLIIIGNNCIL